MAGKYTMEYDNSWTLAELKVHIVRDKLMVLEAIPTDKNIQKRKGDLKLVFDLTEGELYELQGIFKEASDKVAALLTENQAHTKRIDNIKDRLK